MNEKRGPTSGQLEFTFSRRAMFIGGVQAVVGAVVATVIMLRNRDED